MTGLLLRWLLPAGIVVAAGWLLYGKGVSDGRRTEQAAIANKINQDNEEAGDAAEERRARYRRCVDAGGVFNFETGACDG